MDKIPRYDWQKSPAIFEALKVIVNAGNPIAVKDIANEMKKGVPIVSEHLSYLRKNKVVKFAKEGRDKYYWIDFADLKKKIGLKHNDEHDLKSAIHGSSCYNDFLYHVKWGEEMRAKMEKLKKRYKH